jgi:hypothetical protein
MVLALFIPLGLLPLGWSQPPRKTDMAEEPVIVKLADFKECAKAGGWQETYIPQRSPTVQHAPTADCPPEVAAHDRVTVIYNWVVLSSVEVPSVKTRSVTNPFRNARESTYPLLYPDAEKHTITFSTEPAVPTLDQKASSSIEVETKANESKLVVVLQQTVAIHSAGPPFQLLVQGYTNRFAFGTFAFGTFTRPDRQPPNKQ